jgi:ribosomal protein L37AE/L43A
MTEPKPTYTTNGRRHLDHYPTETAVSHDTCPDCNGTATKRFQDGSLYCYSCTSLVSVPPEETAVSGDDYNYTAELEKSIEAAETAVSDPWVCGACAQEFGNEVDLLAHQFNSSCEEELKEGRGAGRASIVDSLKSTEWLIEEDEEAS